MLAGLLLAAAAAPARAEHVELSLVSGGPRAGGADAADVLSLPDWCGSADGSHVVFYTDEPLVDADGDASRDAYEHVGGVTTLVSDRIQSGPDAEILANPMGCSPDGSRILVQTREPLTDDDDDTTDDLYMREGGTSTLISDDPAADATDVNADVGVFTRTSTDLSVIYFDTAEPFDAVNDTDQRRDGYKHVLGNPAQTLVTDRVQAGPDGNTFLAHDANVLNTSADGSRVFFHTREQLVDEDDDSAKDYYEFSGNGPAVLRTDRAQSNADSADPAVLQELAADGSRLVFITREQILAADGDTALDLYEVANGAAPTLVSDRVKAGADENKDVDDPFKSTAATSDGLRIFFQTREQLVDEDADANGRDVYERSGGTTKLISGGTAETDADLRGVSADGSSVFFVTGEALVPEDGDAAQDGYVRNGSTTTLLTDRVQPGADAAAAADIRGWSPDGSRVFFETPEPLLSSDGDTAIDVYERVGGAIYHLSDRVPGDDPATDVFLQSVAPDGSRAFLVSDEPLVAGDGDSTFDIYEARIVPDVVTPPVDPGPGPGPDPGPGPGPQPPPDPTIGVPSVCVEIRPGIRKRTKAIPGGGEVLLTVAQSDDPTIPLKITAGARRGVKIKSVAFKVNKKAVTGTGSTAKVPVGALKIGKRNPISVVITLTNGKKVTVNEIIIVLKCPLPPVTCQRLSGGTQLKCSSSMPLRARAVKVTVTGLPGQSASGSTKVKVKKGAKKGAYSLTMKPKNVLLPGKYVYKHVATTARKGEKLLAVRVLILG